MSKRLEYEKKVPVTNKFNTRSVLAQKLEKLDSVAVSETFYFRLTNMIYLVI